MLIKLQKKMWDAGLDLTEKSLNKMVKDDSFLQWSSMGMNSSLWWQKNMGKGVEVLLKQFNLPDKETIKKLQQSLYELEREVELSRDRVEALESEVAQLRVLIKAKAEPAIKKEVKPIRKKKSTNELFA